MNTIDIHKKQSELEARIAGNFNLRVKNSIEDRLSPEISTLKIDLSACRLVDSEAVIFMFKWQHSGKVLTLKAPPDILFEILDVLEIRDKWNQYNTKSKGT
jgi:ABC-type transporter Mla MlaB component